MISFNLRGMMSRVAKKTRTWISETAVRNSADLNCDMYRAKELKS